MSEKVLSVDHLVINFKTDNGLVHAVRDVSFDLARGETLCIVGESGSGKSVTSKAIMGILANNAVVEQGSITYHGENLLEVSEEEFHKIRGHKIGMIFQDPLSSLNPIVRIGKQITEATLINANKLKQMYNEIISDDLVAYKNVLTKRDIQIQHEQEKFDAWMKDIRSKENSTSEERANNKQQIKQKKLELKQTIAQIKAIAKSNAVPLKAKLKETEQVAKAKVKAYQEQVKQEHQNKMMQLKEALSNAQTNVAQAAIEKEMALEKEHYINQLRITKAEAKRRALEIMREVGIPDPEKRFRQYPFEFSGGMRQRIVIAIALTATPEILICDEPTTALDVTIQAQILELINRIKQERDLSCIFITHDLGVVANMADRVAVMYAGKIVEYGTSEEVFFDPRHPYTWALLSSIPDVDSKEKLEAIPGTPPNMIYPPKGDAFALRSKYAMKVDFECEPPFFKITDTHYAATWLLDERAPKVEMPKIVSERIKNAQKEEK
ncbi:MAG: ATP-binding cassette domain-containing protein [Prevotella sp.]|nr:ATP-binding cassette domain-containing protein [Staphylococcus sp.]MCM1350941.1 ATP-binding cassette domain-containing protein [Prevotella sp.]